MGAAAAVLPLLAGLVGAAFAGVVWSAWARKRRAHQLAWALGLTAYSFVALVEAYVAFAGWEIPLYRAYFTLAAGNVGLLGLGTVYLLRSPRAGHAFAAFVAAGVAVAALAQAAVPLALDTPVTSEGETKPLAEWGTSLGGKAVPFPSPARFAFLALNVVGGLALIVGALASWWQSRAAGVLLIGIGACFPFLGGSLATLGVVEARVITQFVGIAVMFVGYLAGSAAAHPPAANGAGAAAR